MKPEAPPLWTIEEIRAATGGEGTAKAPVTHVSIDTRTLSPGDLFIALRGPNADGHDYIPHALEKGAAAVLTENRIQAAGSSGHVYVPDTYSALWNLAGAARKRFKGDMIGLTGSVGKTGTREMLKTMLSSFGKTHATAGNLNNHWGVPLSLSRLPADSRYAVIEMGMNHAGEIGPLSRLACPDVALVTAIAEAHLEFFDSVEDIAEAKAEIFLGLTERGTAVIPVDGPGVETLAGTARIHGAREFSTFADGTEADGRLLEMTESKGVLKARARFPEGEIPFTLPPSSGRHHARNATGAALVLRALGLDAAKGLNTLVDMTLPAGRGRTFSKTINGGAVHIIDEAYNASPASMKAAFDVLARTPGERRIAVLGDMKELGERSSELHADLAESATTAGIDIVYGAGKEISALFNALPSEKQGVLTKNSQKLVPILMKAVRPGDTLLVKGSAASRMSEVVSAFEAL